MTWTQSILGLCPRLSRTEHVLEILPLEISIEILAVPSVTDILQDLIPGSLLTAFVAFIAQSAQSIPLMFQSNSCIPSGTMAETEPPSSMYAREGGVP